MTTDRDKYTHYLRLVYVHSTFSANKATFMDSKLKSNLMLVEYLWLQQLGISHIKALKLVWFPQPHPRNSQGNCS